MCRVYRTKSGTYVRLCYRFSKRQGAHVPVEEGYVLPGLHYLGERRSKWLSPVASREMEVCPTCHGRLGNHASWCEARRK